MLDLGDICDKQGKFRSVVFEMHRLRAMGLVETRILLRQTRVDSSHSDNLRKFAWLGL